MVGSIIRLTVAALACLCLAERARATDIQIRVAPYVACDEAKGVWGVLHDGIEIGTGEFAITPFTDMPPVTLHVDQTLTADDTLELWFTINCDDTVGYVPSVDDLYQHKFVKRIDEEIGWWFQIAADDWQRFTLTSPENLLTVHYHRLDADYANAGLWTWDEHEKRQPELNELLPVGRDAFGLVFQLDIGRYGTVGDRIGLLPRRNRDWQYKDGGDRWWSPSLGPTVYIVQDDNRLYSEKPDVTPKVRRVTLDADHNLTVRFSHRLPVADWTPDKFKVSTSTGEELHVRAVYPFKHRGDQCAMYSIEVAERFEYPEKAYALDVADFGTQNVEVGHIVKDPQRFYDADAVMGATYTAEKTTFRVFAPGALTAQVVIADELTGGHVERCDMNAGDKGIWSADVPGNLAGKYYAYALGGIGFDPEVEIADPYAFCMQGKMPRSLIVDLRATDPDGFRAQQYTLPQSPVDAIVYEMHVRDFTISANSGIERKGKYAGLAEGGTTLPDDSAIKTGIDHLVELGVTHVQIMPVQDFDNDERADDSYNWGYMPVQFNSPDGWYALETQGPGRIRELKAAIQAFHERGIGVILDVVYNHTAGWSPFEKLVPGYYHRLTDAGNFSNGSGCGNEFASENPMARKFILDSVRYWVEEYRVDGFRFDLMGLIDIETMKQMYAELKRIHPGILIYGEPWTGGHTPLKPVTDKSVTRGTGICAFNDHFRDAVKGGRDGGGGGFIQSGADTGKVVEGLMGAVHDWAQDPTDTISYFECHDNLTSWDKLLQSVPEGSDELRRRMMRLGTLTLLTAQGMTFLHSGQEMCRSKQGSSNSYNLPDDVNQIDWSLKKKYADVVAYVRGLIALRKAHPAFRLRTRGDVEHRVHFDAPPNPYSIVYRIDAGGVEGESAQSILVLLNASADPLKFNLPEGAWSVHADAFRADVTPMAQTSGSVTVPAHSGTLLIR